MTISANKLTAHLRRIRCGGQLTSAVLQPDYACLASVRSEQLFIRAQSVGDAPWPEPVGIPDLSLLIQSVKWATDEGDDPASLEVEGSTARVPYQDSAVQFQLHDPSLITSNPDRAEGSASSATYRPITTSSESANHWGSDRVRRITNAISLVGAEEVTLGLDPEATSLRIGSKGTQARFRIPVLTSPQEKTPALDASVLHDVLKNCSNPHVAWQTDGLDRPWVTFHEVGYTYGIRVREADRA